MLAGSLLLLASCTGGDADDPEPTSDLSFVALGDSYAAGGGVGTTTGACLRSDASYPALLAERWGADPFVDRTCGGATTTAVVSDGARSGSSTPAQLEAVTADTDVVTITIGGNDGHFFASYFAGCLAPATASDSVCRQGLALLTKRLPLIEQTVAATLQETHDRAPEADVVLVSYLRLAPTSGTCDALALTEQTVRPAQQLEQGLNEVLRSAAELTGTTFVDAYAASQGHDACSRTPWTNGTVTPPKGDGTILHPTAAGLEAVADLVEAARD